MGRRWVIDDKLDALEVAFFGGQVQGRVLLLPLVRLQLLLKEKKRIHT